MKKTQYKHKLEYNNEYNRNNYRSFSVRFNINSEKDIIKWLEDKESVKSYIVDLINNDMKNSKHTKAKKASTNNKHKPVAKRPILK